MKHVAVGILIRDGRILACQRKRTVRFPLKWEFPGGKLEPGESPAEALVRELHEELAIDALPAEELLTDEWVYADETSEPQRNLAYRVTYFLVRSFRGEPVNLTFEAIQWVSVEQLRDMDVLAGNRGAIELLRTRVIADGVPH